MSDFAIRVEHLGKQYRLDGQQAAYSTFRETLVNAANAPLRWVKGERRAEQNSFWALDDVSFEVKHGEAVGIIGRNGAGKSTLLKILSRITSPTRGRVDIYGRVGSLLEVGTGFHPELSGRENIYLNGAILGMSRLEIARKFDEIVDFSGVEKFLDTPVKHYSSGMYVRLAFAVAAYLEPEILLVDEVLAVGDAAFQRKCLGKMGDVAYEGRTVLFVSHNMIAVQKLCTRSIWLQQGLLLADAGTNYILDQYLNSMSGSNHRSIAELPRLPGFGEKARYVDCCTVNEQGERCDLFKFGETIGFRLGVEARQAIDNVSLSIGIDSSKDYRITTIISDDENVVFKVGLNKKLSVLMKPNHLRLKPGSYYLTLGIRQNKSPLDHVLKAFKFEIASVTSDEKSQDVHILGDIYTDSAWQVE